MKSQELGTEEGASLQSHLAEFTQELGKPKYYSGCEPTVGRSRAIEGQIFPEGWLEGRAGQPGVLCLPQWALCKEVSLGVGGRQHVAQTAPMLSLCQSGFCVRREKLGVLEAVGQLWETPEKKDSP